MKIEISGDTENNRDQNLDPYVERKGAPNGKTDVKPAAILLPAPGRNCIYAHQDISLTKLDRFPSVYQSICSGMLRKMHCNGIYF